MSSAATAELCPVCERRYPPGTTRCEHDGARLVRVDERDPLVGQVLADRFEVLSPLGAGGMGQVYRARQLSVGRDVALKVIAATRDTDAEMVRRFMREARLASQVLHPNTVTVFDFGQTTDGRLWLAMELVEGPSLKDVLTSPRPLPIDMAVDFGIQLCDALTAAHELGIVHRDLKPANVMVLERSGRSVLKVLDFGLARSLDSGEHSRVTREGLACGTPAYISPEGACADPIDHRSDLYSLGIMLYEMAVGTVPFEHENAAKLMALQVTEPPPALPAEVPSLLATIIERLLEKSPDDRFADASTVRASLELVTSGGGGTTESALETGVVAAASRPATPQAPVRTPASSPDAPTRLVEPIARAPQDDASDIHGLGAPPPLVRRVALLVVIGLIGGLIAFLVLDRAEPTTEAKETPDATPSPDGPPIAGRPSTPSAEAPSNTAPAQAKTVPDAAKPVAKPAFTLPPLAPRDIHATPTRAPARRPAAGTWVTIRFESTPSARVTFDETELGVTPVSTVIRQGRDVPPAHFKKAGYRPRKVGVNTRADTVVRATLQRRKKPSGGDNGGRPTFIVPGQ